MRFVEAFSTKIQRKRSSAHLDFSLVALKKHNLKQNGGLKHMFMWFFRFIVNISPIITPQQTRGEMKVEK